jgi:16S rRNA (uracil1498-N3)-methyltransferase
VPCVADRSVNLLLFDPTELAAPLPRGDPRARHLLDVLRRQQGDTFDAGLVNGPRGKGTLLSVGADALVLSFASGAEPPPLPPVTLLVGLPRPQTARDILRDGTTLGVAAIHFVASEKSEPSYASSTLWTSGEWRRHVLAGAAQAFDTRLPEATWSRPLAEACAALPAGDTRLALDNYEAVRPLSALPADTPVALAFGPERGWGAADRALLRAQGFTLAHLGARPLRVETAVVAALAVLQAQRAL